MNVISDLEFFHAPCHPREGGDLDSRSTVAGSRTHGNDKTF